MARNTTLQVLLDDLRSESGHAISSSMGQATQDMMVTLLQRTQRRLWEDFAWPFLQVKKDVSIQAGSRYYDVPAGITLERVQKASFKYGGMWQPVSYGITPEDYTIYDSDRDIRSWPLQRWTAYGLAQIEVWPVPSQNADATTGDGLLRLEGTGNLSTFVALSDTADLDDQLLVLYASSELLTRQKSPDGQLKMAQAQQHYQRLKARLSKTSPVVLGGGEDTEYKARGPLLIHQIG
tara:strand:- start:1242 stop:1949 length:708 start_codon:yes stop_codon:yes gene_type:complete